MSNSLGDLFTTDLSILILYPTGAGGKFITNCLSFHPRFHPQSNVFLPNLDQRILYLEDALLDYAGHGWNDLGMGCMQFFDTLSLSPSSYCQQDLFQHKKDIKAKSMHMVLRTIAAGLYFFKTAHSATQYQFYRDIWPNGKRVMLTNCSSFIRFRNGKGKGDWKVIDHVDAVDKDGAFIFDASSLLRWDQFKDEYIRLLDCFDETPCNLDRLERFYDSYMQKLSTSA
jgi:hypothetical protein